MTTFNGANIKLTDVSPARPDIIATDGSVRDPWIGWAWLSDTGSWAIRARQLTNFGRRYTDLPVFAELSAIAMAVGHNHARPIARIASDSQQAAHLIASWSRRGTDPIPGPPDPVLAKFYRRLPYMTTPLRVDWVKGHAGHPLNEGADALARLGSRALRDGMAQEDVWERARGIASAFAAAHQAQAAPRQELPKGAGPIGFVDDVTAFLLARRRAVLDGCGMPETRLREVALSGEDAGVLASWREVEACNELIVRADAWVDRMRLRDAS